MVRGRAQRAIRFGLVLLAAAGASPGAAAAAGPPQVASTWTTGVSAAAASLHAEVNPGGLATTYRFEYIAASPDYQAHGFEHALKQPAGAPAGLGSGAAGVEALQQVGALSAATTYHYRVAATNSAGTTFGPDTAFITQESPPASVLPDDRGWEMVSPVDKNGGAIQGPEGNYGGDVLQAAVQGGAVTYSSASAFGEAPPGAPPASQYVSRREAGGWATQDVTAYTLSGAYGPEPDGVPYRLFSSDLARGLMLSGRRCGESEPCPHGYSLWEAGAFASVPEAAGGLDFEGASPDLRHLVFASEGGLDEWSGGGLETISAGPGATLAAPATAVSSDGSRAYFTAAGNLYLREGSGVIQVDEAQGGRGNFQTATPNGQFAFFTKSGHLYRFSAGEGLTSTTDLTPSGGVVGVAGASEGGSTVYYQDATGLEELHEGTTATVATGAEAALASDYPPATGTARVSASGEALLFVSTESLTGYDNTDQASGEADSEVFLWENGGGGGGALRCLSCNPTGERPAGASSIPGAIANGSTRAYKPRALAAGGRRAFFESADSLVPGDSDGSSDVYEWEAQGEGTCVKAGGCLAMLSGGRTGEASFIDASESGADAFFLTDASLVSADPGSVDLYDAREDGGFPVPPAPFECVADACQPLPEPPEDPTVGTTIPGPGNPPLRFGRPSCPKGTHRVTKGGKSHCVRRRQHRNGRRR